MKNRVLKIDQAHPVDRGQAFAMMTVGHPLNAEEFRDPWSPFTALPTGTTPEEKAKATAEILRAQKAARDLSVFLDPKINLNAPGQSMLTASTISETWFQIIEGATMAKAPPPPKPEVVKRLEDANAVLYEAAPPPKKGRVPTAASQAYDEYRVAYFDAKFAYVNAFETAQKDGTLASWGSKGQKFISGIDQAMKSWRALGWKKEVEEAQDTIAAQGHEAVESVIGMAKLAYPAWQMAVGGIAATSPYVQVFPKDWADAEVGKHGWTTYGYRESASNATHSESSQTWAANAGVSFGFWSVGGGGGGSSRTEHNEFSSKEIAIEFTIGVVTISRPWLNTLLLNIDGWAVPGVAKHGISRGDMDQTDAPAGTQKSTWMPTIPTQLVIIKNVRFRTEESAKFYDFMQKESKAGASFGWGPFSLGGSSTWSSSSTTTKASIEEGWIKIEGAQLIGYVLQATPACPPAAIV